MIYIACIGTPLVAKALAQASPSLKMQIPDIQVVFEMVFNSIFLVTALWLHSAQQGLQTFDVSNEPISSVELLERLIQLKLYLEGDKAWLEERLFHNVR